ncbi:MAG: FAD:protein FMN transferase [Bacteroidales bacterium]
MKQIMFIAIAILALHISSCNTQSNREDIRIDGFTQGTTYSIVYHDSLNRNFSTGFDSIFEAIDKSMSIYNDSSIISRINRNEQTSVDELLANVLIVSDSVYRETDGAFDITVGPVIRAIGFGKDKSKGIDSAKVRSLIPLIGMNKIKLEGFNLYKSKSEIQIDVNAVAQGYTADVIGDFLSGKGVKNFLVEVGGEVCAKGINNRGTEWVVGLDKPVENAMPGENIQTKIYLSNGMGLATSGNYRKFIEVDGMKYSHTVNPKTGFPVLNSLLSATVIAPTGARADALATAFMVNGLDWSIDFVNSHPEIDAYLIYSDSAGAYKVWLNERMKSRLMED